MNKLQIIPGGESDSPSVVAFDNLSAEQIRAARSYHEKGGVVGTMALYSSYRKVLDELAIVRAENARLKAGRGC